MCLWSCAQAHLWSWWLLCQPVDTFGLHQVLLSWGGPTCPHSPQMSSLTGVGRDGGEVYRTKLAFTLCLTSISNSLFLYLDPLVNTGKRIDCHSHSADTVGFDHVSGLYVTVTFDKGQVFTQEVTEKKHTGLDSLPFERTPQSSSPHS